MAYLTDDQCGDAIYAALQKNGPLSQAGIRHATGLNASEFRRGIDFIRDTLSDQQSVPYAYDPHTNTYVLCTQQKEALRYLRRRTATARKQHQRLMTGTVYPAAAKWGTPAWLQLQHQADQMDLSLDFTEQMVDHAINSAP